MNENAKAVITIEIDDHGRPCAKIVFDPPLPERPAHNSEAEEQRWLESIPSTQLAGIVVMDEIMDMFGGDLEMIGYEVSDHGTKH